MLLVAPAELPLRYILIFAFALISPLWDIDTDCHELSSMNTDEGDANKFAPSDEGRQPIAPLVKPMLNSGLLLEESAIKTWNAVAVRRHRMPIDIDVAFASVIVDARLM